MNLGQVYTKRQVADFMVGLFSLNSEAKVLDPCFGHGVFINSVLDNTDFHLNGVEIDRQSFDSFCNPNPERCELINSDFFDVDDEFDGIIMNPPYIRQEEIDALSELGVSKQKLQDACGLMAISTKANMYMYFILRSILLLRDKGELIAIFPNSWTNTPVGQQFREQMEHFGKITQFIDIEGEAFEGSPMVDVCIIKFVRNGRGETIYQIMKIADGSLQLERKAKRKKSRIDGLVKLSSFCQIRRGVTTGANKLFVNVPLFTQDHIVDILSSPKDFQGYSTQKCRLDKLLVLSPEDKLNEEESTYIHNCGLFIQKEGKPETLKRQIDAGQTWYTIKLPSTAQILFSYIVRENLKFVLNDGERQVRDNFYMITSKENDYLMVALLNNYHVFIQLENCGKSYGKGLLKLQKYDIDAIQVPRTGNISSNDKDDLIRLGKRLVETSDINVIDDISSIMSTYYQNDESKQQFLSMKQKRLSNHE